MLNILLKFDPFITSHYHLHSINRFLNHQPFSPPQQKQRQLRANFAKLNGLFFLPRKRVPFLVSQFLAIGQN